MALLSAGLRRRRKNENGIYMVFSFLQAVFKKAWYPFGIAAFAGDSMLVGKYVPKEKEGINIALYLQDTTDKYESKESNLKENWKNMGIRLVEELSDSGTADHRTDSQNLFHFYLCDSEERAEKPGDLRGSRMRLCDTGRFGRASAG